LNLDRRVLALMVVPMAAASGCLGDVDDGVDSGSGGTGGSEETGGGAGEGGATGGTHFGGANTGGDASNGGGFAGGESYPADAFVTVWSTCRDDCCGNVPGTSWRTIELPLVPEGTYDFVVDWGDGTTGEVTSAEDEDRAHTSFVSAAFRARSNAARA